MHERILLVSQVRHRAWCLPGHESEQDVFSHGVFAAETVSVERKGRLFLSAGASLPGNWTHSVEVIADLQFKRPRAALGW